jgi:hypothetical protein
MEGETEDGNGEITESGIQPGIQGTGSTEKSGKWPVSSRDCQAIVDPEVIAE